MPSSTPGSSSAISRTVWKFKGFVAYAGDYSLCAYWSEKLPASADKLDICSDKMLVHIEHLNVGIGECTIQLPVVRFECRLAMESGPVINVVTATSLNAETDRSSSNGPGFDRHHRRANSDHNDHFTGHKVWV